MSQLTVDIQHASVLTGLPDDASLDLWAGTGWQQEEPSEVTLRIVDRAESAQLNGQYRNRPQATNVLSFPYTAPPGITVPLAGDLVICAPVVADEAAAQGKTLRAHWAHMVIHGMLHLQGYDHIEDDQAERMEALEIRLLARLGFSNPYDTEDMETDS